MKPNFWMWIFSILLTANAATSKENPSSPESEWMQWRQERLERLNKSERPFIAVTASVYMNEGQTAYLTNEKWMRVKPTGKALSKTRGELVFDGKSAKATFNGKTRDLLKDNNWKISESELLWGNKLQDGGLRVLLFNKKSKDFKKFKDFEYFKFNPQAIVQGTFTLLKAPQKTPYKTYQDRDGVAYKIGSVQFEWKKVPVTLTAYNWQDPQEDKKYAILAFRDQTGGKESYAGGRELEVSLTPQLAKEGGSIELDFNKTINFLCAHNSNWNCPLALTEKVDVAIAAGEKKSPLKFE